MQIRFFCLNLFIVASSINHLFASSYDYIYPFQNPSISNYGSIGLIQNPTARFATEGTLAFSWTHNEPYLRGSLIAYPFSWMEASFQYTDVNNQLYSNISSFSGSQSLKDKSFDIKIKLFNEKRLLPQIAVGARDLGGTGLFSSEYLVFNKYIKENIDFSFGIGWGHLNGRKIKNPLTYISNRFNERNSDTGLGGKVNLNNFFSGDAGYFAGLEISIPRLKGLRAKLELDGTNYETEATKPIKQSSYLNYGFVYPINENLFIKFSSVRGEVLNFGFSYSLNFKERNPFNVKKQKAAEIENAEVIKKVAESKNNIYRASLLYLQREGINLQHANIDDTELNIVYAQSSFRSPALSAGRVINYLDQITSERIKKFTVTEVNGGLGLFKASIDREIYRRYKSFDAPELLDEYFEIQPVKIEPSDYMFNPEAKYPAYYHSLGPDLRSQIGGPDGFFFGDLKLSYESELLLSKNLSLISNLSYGVFDNMDSLKLASDSVLPHVRTDIVQYLKQSRGLSVGRMQLNYFTQLSNSIYFKLSGGILESMFNGIGFEALYRPFYKNYGVGIDLWQVYQRGYDQKFKILDYDTVTGHLTFYYQEPYSNILFQFKGGRYLAGDSGITIDASRVFQSGFRIGAFFSLTDISAEEFGEGSFDKGFYFWIPLDLFSKNYFRRTFGWGLRPITRDGAQQVIQSFPLWGVTNSSSNEFFRKNLDEIFN